MRISDWSSDVCSSDLTWDCGYRRNCKAISASSTDLPDPVGPTISMWPTSPTWVEKRNGVVPAVSARKSGGPSRCSFRAGPAQIADSGTRCARFKVGTSGWRTLEYTWQCQLPTQHTAAVHFTRTVVHP